MKVLIIPDVHARRFWKKAVDEHMNEVDKVVFLGDYCDPYQDEGIEYSWEDTLSNFEEILQFKKDNPDKVVLLLGNHDEHYRSNYYSKIAMSTRYDKAHSQKIAELLNGDNRSLFKICHTEEIGGKKVVFSHAGITKFWLDKCKMTFDEELINSLEDSIEGLKDLGVIGFYRTWVGEKTGSILWCDVREFVTNEGLGDEYFQVFGHTRLGKGKSIIDKNYACIDSQEAFIMDEDGIKIIN